MAIEGLIFRISISKSNGTKKRNIASAVLLDNFGIVGDAHAGSARQVSLLPYESLEKMQNDLLEIKPGDFAENFTVSGLCLSWVHVGRTLGIGSNVEQVVTQIGKECHNRCHIRQVVGNCIMPREAVFARILKDGRVRIGDMITLESKSMECG